MNSSDRKSGSRKHWLDSQGDELPINELKAVSRSWSMEEWEGYLQSQETPRQEGLFSNFDRMLLKHDAERAAACAADEGDPESSGHLFVSRRSIRHHISNLTPKQRQVIEMYFFEGKSLTQITQILGISRRASTSHMKRARDRLKHALTTSLHKHSGKTTNNPENEGSHENG